MSNDKQAERITLPSSTTYEGTFPQTNQAVTKTERLEISIEAANSIENQQSAPVTPQPILEEEAADETRPLLADNDQEDSDSGAGIGPYTTDPSERKGLPLARSLWSSISPELLQPLLQNQPIELLLEEELQETDTQVNVSENKESNNADTLFSNTITNLRTIRPASIEITLPSGRTITILPDDIVTDLQDLKRIAKKLQRGRITAKEKNNCLAISLLLIFASVIDTIIYYAIYQPIVAGILGSAITPGVPIIGCLFTIFLDILDSLLQRCCRLDDTDQQILERFDISQDQAQLESLEKIILALAEKLALKQATTIIQQAIPPAVLTALVVEYGLPILNPLSPRSYERTLQQSLVEVENKPSSQETTIETKIGTMPIISSAANEIEIIFPSSEPADIPIQMINSNQLVSRSRTSSFFSQHAANQLIRSTLSSYNIQQTTSNQNDNTEKILPRAKHE